jgi:O-antigen/teichoic acid export membrane protein
MTVTSEIKAAPGKRIDRTARRRSDAVKVRGVYPLYIAANIAPRLAMFVVLIVLTRLLPVAEYGLFALVVTTGEILEMSWTNWIRVYLLRTEAGTAKLRPRRLGRALVLSACGALAGLVTSTLVVPFLNPDHTAEMLVSVLIYIAAFALLRTTLTLLQLSRSHIIYATVECGRGISILAATITAALIEPQSFFPTSVALSLATGGSAAIGIALATRTLGRPQLPRGGYLVALAFGVPYVLANTLFYTIGWFDRFIINFFMGPAQVGIYVAAYSLARQPIDLFVGSLNTFTFPMLVHAYAGGGARRAGPVQSGLLITMTALGLGIVVGLMLLARPLAGLLFPPSYSAQAATLMPWIALATFILSIKQFIFDNSLHAAQQNWLHLVAMIAPVIVSVSCGILLIRGYGLIGAASNYLITSVVAMISGALISFRIFAFLIPWRDLAKVSLSAAAAGLAVWLILEHTHWGALPTLVAASSIFCFAYGALLIVCGFSLRRLIETPWAPLDGPA